MLTGGFAALPVTSGALVSTVIPTWVFKYSRADAPLERYHRRVLLTAWTSIACGGGLIAAVMLWVAATNGSPRIWGIPAAAVVILIAGVLAWSMRVGAQLPHLRERNTARRLGVRAFAVGTFPLTRTYIVVASDGLMVLRGSSAPICRIAWTDVDVVAVATSRAGVGVSMSINEQWHDFPIVLEVGGPTASAYSSAPTGAQKRLLTVVQKTIEPHAIVHADSR
jgi:hypothetical protein